MEEGEREEGAEMMNRVASPSVTFCTGRMAVEDEEEVSVSVDVILTDLSNGLCVSPSVSFTTDVVL